MELLRHELSADLIGAGNIQAGSETGHVIKLQLQSCLCCPAYAVYFLKQFLCDGKCRYRVTVAANYHKLISCGIG